MKPKVSIVIPVYNREKYISETIQSCLDQDFLDYEIILVDDGSNDSSLDIIRNFKDSKIRCIEIPENSGVVNALNIGIQNSNSDYIYRVDSDDILLKDSLNKMYNFMESNPEVNLAGGYVYKIDEKGNLIGKRDHVPLKDFHMKIYSVYRNPINGSCIFRKSVFNDIGGYKNFPHIEDFELWTRFFAIGKVANIPEYLFKYRIHPKQVSSEKHLQIRLIGVYVRILSFLRVLKYFLKIK